MHETIAIIDFGSQYSQLIARRVRENHVRSILFPPGVSVERLRLENVAGIILSGGPASVYAENAPRCDRAILEMGVPVLGICYGMQLGSLLLGAEVKRGPSSEFGRVHLRVAADHPLVANVPRETTVWMSHADLVSLAPDSFEILASTKTCRFAAAAHREKPFYGVQFHPEVAHTPDGSLIIRNFLYRICQCSGGWSVGQFASAAVERVRERVGPDARVICALSGGIDSSVTAVLLHEAVGDRLFCIHVDNGLMRTGETALVAATFRDFFHIHLSVVDASDRFLQALAGVIDPMEKRKIIGREFIEVFKQEALTIEGARFLAQGTLYPDVIESGHSVGGQAAKIKLHHNVGALPAELGFELVEPLRDLFKDEVRVMGEYLGLPEEMVWRHPFPGPGLAVRIIGEVTAERLAILREADRIVTEEIKACGWYRKTAQAFAVLVPVQTVGVMGDAVTYDAQHIAAIRVVESADFMTADWVHLERHVLGAISSRIINEVPGINRVVYDISTKPPATIEWE